MFLFTKYYQNYSFINTKSCQIIVYKNTKKNIKIMFLFIILVLYIIKNQKYVIVKF